MQVRIYEVKKEDALGRDLPAANQFAKGKRRKTSAAASKSSERVRSSKRKAST